MQLCKIPRFQHGSCRGLPYLVIPFGLTNVLPVFQTRINYILRDMISDFVFVYLDDI